MWCWRPERRVRYSLLMNRSDLIDCLAERAKTLPARDAEVVVSVILDALAGTLASGGRVEIRGFGSFALNYQRPRQGRNPKTGERLRVPAKYLPRFRVGKELRERVDCVSARPGFIPGGE